jgi:hypothetical protein
MPEYNESVSKVASSDATPAGNAWVPQFTSTDYGKPSSTRCRLCSNSIFSEYFKVNGQKVCPTCAEQARSGQSTASHGSLMGGIIFGIVGAIIAMILYSIAITATGWTIGYLAIAVGWIVGKAVMTGANNVGSFRIQVVALLLTYTAISLSALPAILYNSYGRSGFAIDLIVLLRDVILPGLASPFLRFQTNSLNAALGMVILLIGLRIAWRLTQTKPLAVAGPYTLTAQ